MKYFIQKLFFAKGDGVKTSIMIPKAMNEALEDLRRQGNKRSTNEVILILLDQILVEMAQNGVIKPPEGEEQFFNELSAAQASKSQAS